MGPFLELRGLAGMEAGSYYTVAPARAAYVIEERSDGT